MLSKAKQILDLSAEVLVIFAVERMLQQAEWKYTGR